MGIFSRVDANTILNLAPFKGRSLRLLSTPPNYRTLRGQNLPVRKEFIDNPEAAIDRLIGSNSTGKAKGSQTKELLESIQFGTTIDVNKLEKFAVYDSRDSQDGNFASQFLSVRERDYSTANIMAAVIGRLCEPTVVLIPEILKWPTPNLPAGQVPDNRINFEEAQKIHHAFGLLFNQAIPQFNLWRNRNPRLIIPCQDMDFREKALNGANLSLLDFTGSDLREASLNGVDLTKSRLSHVDLSRAQMQKAKLFWTTIYKSLLIGVNLEEAEVTLAQFIGSNLSGAVMNRVYVHIPEESKSLLYWVRFENSRLTDTQARESYLPKALFKDSSIDRASLQSSNLWLATFSGIRSAQATDMRHTNLDNVTIERESNLMGALTDNRTSMNNMKVDRNSFAPVILG